MKYPSADSLNSALYYKYKDDDFIEMEQHILETIDWQLHQYTTYDFVNLFLAHGCLFKSDQILTFEKGAEVKPTVSTASSLRRYAEFFTDFCVQEAALVRTEPLVLASAIIAMTRKHNNLETIWTEEMVLLTTQKFAQLKNVFEFVDAKYAKNFPESVMSQQMLVNGRQKVE